jgi:beta-galactosidase
LQWNVKYAPGSLSAKGYNGTALAASETVETTGPPASLRLKTDRATLVADAEDVTPVEVDVLDAKGRLVPTADSLVTFQVEGAGCVAGVGNGNPGDHDPDKAGFRHAFNGKCLVVIGATDKRGSIVLTATSPGLKKAVLSLRAAPAAE